MDSRYVAIFDSSGDTCSSISSGNMVILDQLEVGEAHKTMGVTTAPDGNITAEYERLFGESQKWASQVKAGNLQKIDAWLALQSTI
jgi:hypothetical protein